MSSRLVAITFGAHDPLRLAGFWAGVLGWDLVEDASQGVDGRYGAGGAPAAKALLPVDDTGFGIRFLPSADAKLVRNQVHFDLTSRTLEDQQATVERAIGLGARHIDVGQRPEEGHVVLADPEGNEFCVIEPGNRFLADCGFLGAVVCDGTREVGYFWSKALDWPLVWDQDQETAIRSPHGGPKVTWGGPPLAPRAERNRLHFDLLPAAGELPTEVDRLLSLGATLDPGAHDRGAVLLHDPDGNEFCLLPAG